MIIRHYTYVSNMLIIFFVTRYIPNSPLTPILIIFQGYNGWWGAAILPSYYKPQLPRPHYKDPLPVRGQGKIRNNFHSRAGFHLGIWTYMWIKCAADVAHNTTHYQVQAMCVITNDKGKEEEKVKTSLQTTSHTPTITRYDTQHGIILPYHPFQFHTPSNTPPR